MPFEIVDIDHLMIRVANLDAAVETFRSFGFTVTPERRNVGMAALAQEDRPAGAAARGNGKAPFNNRLILLKPYPGRDDVANFIELMCMEEQFGPPEVTQMMSFMLDTEGPKTIVCYTHDLERTRRAMKQVGVVSVAPKGFDTGWDDADRFIPIRARPCIPIFRQTPFMVNAYETPTLDSYRYEPWTVHENSAQYMAGVTGVTDDLEAHVQWMAERVFGVEPEWQSDEIALVHPRDIDLRIVSPAGFAELYPELDFSRERILPALCGVTVAVASLDRVRETLTRNRVKYVETPSGGIAIPRQLAANTVVEFVAADESGGS